MARDVMFGTPPQPALPLRAVALAHDCAALNQRRAPCLRTSMRRIWRYGRSSLVFREASMEAPING